MKALLIFDHLCLFERAAAGACVFVAVCCSALQWMCCNMLQCVTVGMLSNTPTVTTNSNTPTVCYSGCVAICCCVLQWESCNILRCVVVCWQLAHACTDTHLHVRVHTWRKREQARERERRIHTHTHKYTCMISAQNQWWEPGTGAWLKRAEVGFWWDTKA